MVNEAVVTHSERKETRASRGDANVATTVVYIDSLDSGTHVLKQVRRGARLSPQIQVIATFPRGDR